MRLAIVLLLTVVAAQTVTAEPGIFGDIIASIKNATSNAVNKAIEKAKDLYRSALGQFSSLADKLKELEKKFRETGGEMFKSSLDSAKKFVNSTEKQIQQMLKAIDEKLEFVTKETVQILLKETSDLHKWANATLDNLDDPAKRAKAQVILEKFVDKSLDKMNNCAKEATKPIQELYEYANATATEAAALARKIVDLLETCSKGNQMITCVAELPGIMKEGNDLMTNKIGPMKSKVAAIGTKGAVKFSACVATAKIGIEFEKSSVERKVKALA